MLVDIVAYARMHMRMLPNDWLSAAATLVDDGPLFQSLFDSAVELDEEAEVQAAVAARKAVGDVAMNEDACEHGKAAEQRWKHMLLTGLTRRSRLLPVTMSSLHATFVRDQCASCLMALAFGAIPMSDMMQTTSRRCLMIAAASRVVIKLPTLLFAASKHPFAI